MLDIQNLSVSIQETPVVKNACLKLTSGSITALMGANGSGKSSLAHALAGHPLYQITGGTVTLGGQDLLKLSPDQRARNGLFLAFQQPLAIPGVLSVRFLKEAYQAVKGIQISHPEFVNLLTPLLEEVGLSPETMHRPLHEGFSGGEKKRWELVQMLLLQPKVAILDEIDSGLDSDGLKLVAHSIKKLQLNIPEMIILVITHYPRLLEYLQPKTIHIMNKGTIVTSGGLELIYDLEQRGYDAYQSSQAR